MTAPTPITHFVRSNGIVVRCLEWPLARAAMDKASRSVLLLHGLTSCAETWSLVGPELASEGHRVIAADLRGHGDTDKPDEGYDYPSVCEDLVGLLDTLRVEQIVVVGQSYGAGVAAELAGRLPDRVTSLVMVEGGFFRGSGPVEPTPERLAAMLAPSEIYVTQETYLEACFSSFPGPHTPELERIYLSSIYHHPDGSVREKLSREHQKLIVREMLTTDGRARYQRVRCPALFLAAQSSDPAAAQRMAEKVVRVEEAARLLPNATVRWVPDTIHDIQLHKPHEVVAAVLEVVAGE